MNNSSVFFEDGNIIEINASRILELKKSASQSSLKRARICFHKQEDPIHEMIIAFCKNSYIRPHKHIDKVESFHVIEGNLCVLFFDDYGNNFNKLFLSDAKNHAMPFFYKLSNAFWHSIIPLSEYVVIHEVTNGPFIKEKTLYPEWAPQEDQIDKIEPFLQKHRS